MKKSACLYQNNYFSWEEHSSEINLIKTLKAMQAFKLLKTAFTPRFDLVYIWWWGRFRTSIIASNRDLLLHATGRERQMASPSERRMSGDSNSCLILEPDSLQENVHKRVLGSPFYPGWQRPLVRPGPGVAIHLTRSRAAQEPCGQHERRLRGSIAEEPSRRQPHAPVFVKQVTYEELPGSSSRHCRFLYHAWVKTRVGH